MLSQRRLRAIVVTALVVVIMYFYYSSESQRVQNQDFYRNTVAAINAHKGDDGAKGPAVPGGVPQHKEYGDEYVVGDKEEPAIPKAPRPVVPVPAPVPGEQDTEDIPIAGRKVMTVPKEKDRVGAADTESAAKEEPEVDEQKEEAKAELNDILKRSPIIVFSKSYCPYSKKAKSILVGKYSIVPAPFVVELDQHPLGPKLQALLAENTGRRTVPNILVNGKSIGGGDDIAAMDAQDQLASKLKSLGGKWLQDVSRKEDEPEGSE
ncbi:hypothetical protein P175DRAFT_0498940 [Aspergillus ochraceoroseus IBT 24754]|uniref:Glutaredoxin domain-containing protein n=2 Tax=Aspergillus ochraceoroseus TaxID=138278 RepID=A0A2T5M1J8_9EURO|nr:uncharacterized protein P175DRAFT_0498940 [Aspergillus ochraceoroseus IBT 24754]KKK14479.1 hypothetical protein AOCH_006337 [Aspergillus ochraceoroseus]PTU22405.1 hypothetical protein P175DRAFT_0498940 [Aspergillus ochraceoroseus IBT 24754]